MHIQLSDHFTYRRLIRFTIPSIVMMIFTSIYSVVDGLFVTNFVGKAEFTAVNLIMPFTQILGCIGFMFGSGGSALVSKTLGEGKPEKADRIFSMLTYTALGCGVVLAVVGIALLEPIAIRMGAVPEILPHCLTYGRILLVGLPAFMLQNMFQSFLITAEKPHMGLAITVVAGVTNMVLDALFIVGLHWGVAGAAMATILAQCIGGVIPFIYFFSHKNTSLLHLGKTGWDGRAMLQACTNGMSELVSNISMSIVGMLYNYQLMRFDPENGVAAYGVVMYVGFVFIAIFLGYAIGVAPVIGYHYGAANKVELTGLFRKSLVIVVSSGAVLSGLAFGFARPLSMIFAGYDPELLSLTITAMRYYAATVLCAGVAIFGSAFFTALNDGVVSAVISFLRTLVFQIAMVLILPIFFQLDGVWYSQCVSECMAMCLTVAFFIGKRKKYGYWGEKD